MCGRHLSLCTPSVQMSPIDERTPPRQKHKPQLRPAYSQDKVELDAPSEPQVDAASREDVVVAFESTPTLCFFSTDSTCATTSPRKTMVLFT